MEHRSIRVAGDPFVKFGAAFAWRASDAISNGAVTTALKSYIGDATLVRDSAGQGIRRCSSIFPGRFTISFDGVDASRGFTAVILPSAPSAFTFATVAYISANTSGTHALTVAGAANSGNSAGYDVVTTFSQKVLTAVSRAQAQPLKLIVVTTVDSSGVSHYANSITPVTGAVAGALAGTSLTIGALDNAGTYTLSGELERAGCWLRALSASDAGLVMKTLATEHRVTLS